MTKENAADDKAAADKKPEFLNHAGLPVFFESEAVAAIEGSAKPNTTLVHLKSGQTLELQGEAVAIAKEFFDA